MNAAHRILVVDDEQEIRRLLKDILTDEGYQVEVAKDGAEALKKFNAQYFPVVILDIVMAGMDGIAVLKKMKEHQSDAHVIMLTARATTMEEAVEAMKLGAYDYLRKGARMTDEILLRIQKALEDLNLTRQNIQLQEEIKRLGGFGDIIGTSETMQKLFDTIARVAPTDTTVLILGETGTGKELVARAIHERSPRKDGPFIPIDCIPETLAESELFGHEKGAFTNAGALKRGKFEIADGGTLFLDEIGELPLGIQVKLLRVLEEREIWRLGSDHPISVDIRILAATNKNLKEAVKERSFREDLFHRLDVITIRVPPLNERREDIPLLIDYFIEMYCKETKKSPLKISPEALELLQNHDFPGNVRELRNLIERAVVLTQGQTILPDVFPSEIRNPSDQKAMSDLTLLKFSEAKERFEQIYFESLLKSTKGNISQAARKAGMYRKNFKVKMKKYGITPDLNK